MFQAKPCHSKQKQPKPLRKEQRFQKSPKRKQRQRQCSHRQAHDDLKAEGMADAVMVTLAMELGGEDARTGGGAEHAQVEDHGQLVGNGHAGHGQLTYRADHDVIQQAYKLGDAVLYGDGNGDEQNLFQKGPIAENRSKHRKPH